MHSHRADWRRIPRLGALLLACTVLPALTSCSLGSNTASKHLEIATLFAVTSKDAAMQLPVQYGIDLAVSQAHLPHGYTLSVLHETYGGPDGVDPQAGADVTHTLVNNAHVVGVIGPFNSSVAEAVMPITNQGGLSVISPSNADPGLTMPQYAPEYGTDWNTLHPSGHPNRYFRLVANDVEQGELDAYFAAHVLGAKTVFVVDDNTAYGIGLANSFTSAFTSIAGHTVESVPGIGTAGDFSLPPLVSAIVARNPDLVYYGGVSSGGGGQLKGYLVAAGYTRPLLGGDGIANDPYWLTSAQAGAGDTFGSVAAPDVSVLTSRRAKQFVSAYETYVATQPETTLSPWSVMAYDAANALIKAITIAIEQEDGRPLAHLRAQTGDNLASSQFEYAGITGDISFDRYGDNSGQKVLSVYRVSSSSNQWSFILLYQCTGSGPLSCRNIPNV